MVKYILFTKISLPIIVNEMIIDDSNAILRLKIFASSTFFLYLKIIITLKYQ